MTSLFFKLANKNGSGNEPREQSCTIDMCLSVHLSATAHSACTCEGGADVELSEISYAGFHECQCCTRRFLTIQETMPNASHFVHVCTYMCMIVCTALAQ